MHGAAGGEVTGSAHLLQTDRANVLIDCGMFQGSRAIENHNRLPQRGPLARLDAVVLTHAHLDHTGRLPLLARLGYRGPVFATPATIELTDLVLRDSARLQKEDVKRLSRRRGPGSPRLEPLYGERDVTQVRRLFQPLLYGEPAAVAPGITVQAFESGHVLGAVSLEVTVEEAGKRKVVVFSGDLGRSGAPLHRDPTHFQAADLVFMETTYGDREHPSLQETAVAAREAVRETVERGGRVLVPVFAIGRTQILLYLLAGAFKRRTLRPFPIFIDSPMAAEVTTLYRKHRDLFDEEAAALAQSGELAASLRTVKTCATPAESRALASLPGPFLVMAGSGMCTGGRILHHLQNHLGDPSTLVLMAGYQSRGSLGRRILEGAKSVRIMGREVAVKAKAHTFSGLSGHAGQSELLAWVGSMAPSRPRVILTHGEDGPRRALRDRIRERYGLQAEMPGARDTIEA